jgi:hypothetical protein
MNFYDYQYKYILEIAGDSRFDKEYLENHVSKIAKSLFNLYPYIGLRKNQNSIYLRLISKGLINYLVSIGFKKGRKEQIGVPEWILNNEDYMISFLKGIADTDCSLYFRGGSYPIIGFVSKSEPLIRNIFDFIQKKGFILSNYYKEKRIDKRGYNDTVVYTIKLNGRKNYDLWLNLIHFRNPRHLNKIKKWERWNLNPRFRKAHF